MLLHTFEELPMNIYLAMDVQMNLQLETNANRYNDKVACEGMPS